MLIFLPKRSDIGIPVRILKPTTSDIILNSKTVKLTFNYVSTLNGTCQSKSLNKGQNVPEHLQDLFRRSCKSLSPEQSQELKQLLLIKHQNVFAKSTDDLGRTSVVKHEIHIEENAKPIKQRPQIAPMAFAKEEDKIIQEQLKAGVIRESSSPWTCPLVYVRKKDGGTRPCVDYKKLNQLTTVDVYPLPNMNDCSDALGEDTLFSFLKLRSAINPKLHLYIGEPCTSTVPCLLVCLVPLRHFKDAWN